MQAPAVLADARVSDHCDIVAGDFFEAVPHACDAYLLKSVIHDWNDERSLAILSNCRAAMPPNATLLIVEPVMPASAAALAQQPVMVMSDLNMLVCTGGKERTVDEFRLLLSAAGFLLETVTPCPPPTNHSILRAVPRS